MPKINDLTGQRFGKLTVISRAENDKNGKARWNCRCDCGNFCIVSRSNLKSGNVKSCGCSTKEFQSNSHKTHGMRYTRLYKTWNNMKDRCNNPKCHAYANYGGRGIKVCKEWQENFMNFYDWAMQNGYSDSLTIDRINVNKGYCPENCQWANTRQQSNNRRNNHFIEYHGKVHTLKEWSEIFRIPYVDMKSRTKDGWPIEKILNTPVKHYRTRVAKL